MSLSGSAEKGVLKIHWFNVVGSCCNFFLMVVLLKALASSEIPTGSDSVFLNLAWNIIKNTEMFSYICIYLHQIYRFRDVKKFMMLVYIIDEKVKE